MFNECTTSAFQRQGSDRSIGHWSLLPRRATEPIAASLILNISISEPQNISDVMKERTLYLLKPSSLIWHLMPYLFLFTDFLKSCKHYIDFLCSTAYASLSVNDTKKTTKKNSLNCIREALSNTRTLNFEIYNDWLIVLLLNVPSQQLWSLWDGQFT